MSVPELPPEWYYARFQAVGRAQSRYILLLLLISAYTLGIHFSTGDTDTANVAFLGLNVPKPIVNAVAVLVVGVLVIALCGTFPAIRQAFTNLLTRLGNKGIDTEMYFIDQHPNVADFLSYATLWEGKEGPLTRRAALVLYPLPIWFFLLCAGLSWWWGVSACPREPRWVLWLYVADAVVLVVAAIRAAGTHIGLWRAWRTRTRIGGAS
jgi:hypothetical protein